MTLLRGPLAATGLTLALLLCVPLLACGAKDEGDASSTEDPDLGGDPAVPNWCLPSSGTCADYEVPELPEARPFVLVRLSTSSPPIALSLFADGTLERSAPSIELPQYLWFIPPDAPLTAQVRTQTLQRVTELLAGPERAAWPRPFFGTDGQPANADVLGFGETTESACLNPSIDPFYGVCEFPEGFKELYVELLRLRDAAGEAWFEAETGTLSFDKEISPLEWTLDTWRFLPGRHGLSKEEYEAFEVGIYANSERTEFVFATKEKYTYVGGAEDYLLEVKALEHAFFPPDATELLEELIARQGDYNREFGAWLGLPLEPQLYSLFAGAHVVTVRGDVEAGVAPRYFTVIVIPGMDLGPVDTL